MAIPKFLEDLNIIARLGNKPGTDDGLSDEGFKAKFDEGILKIQTYINDVLIPGIENSVSEDGLLAQINNKLAEKLSLDGGTMRGPLNMDYEILSGIDTPFKDDHAASKGYVDSASREIATDVATTAVNEITLSATGWTVSGPYTQTVTVSGLADNLRALVYPKFPDDATADAALAEETVKVSKCTRSGNKMTFTCREDKPTANIPVIVEVRL